LHDGTLDEKPDRSKLIDHSRFPPEVAAALSRTPRTGILTAAKDY
jgi:hypothetical protein